MVLSMVSNGSDDGGAEGGGSTASEIIVLVFIVLGLGRVHYRRTLRQRRKDAARQLCPDGLALPLDPSSSHPNAPVARHDPLSEPVASTGSSPHPSQDGIGAMTADRRLAEGRRMHLRLVGLDRYMSPGNMVSASTANAHCVPRSSTWCHPTQLAQLPLGMSKRNDHVGQPKSAEAQLWPEVPPARIARTRTCRGRKRQSMPAIHTTRLTPIRVRHPATQHAEYSGIPTGLLVHMSSHLRPNTGDPATHLRRLLY